MRHPANLDGDSKLLLQLALDLFADGFLAAGLGSGELPVISSALAVCLPFDLVCRQFCLDTGHRLIEDLRLQIAFPDGNDAPGQRFQPLDGQLVAFLVASYLLHPELGVGFRNRVVLAAFVPVPEAAVHEDGGAVLRQHDVRRAGEGADIETITVAGTMEGLSHLQLGSCVPRSDVRHRLMTLYGCKNIRHIP